MSINVVSTGYHPTGYADNKTTNAEAGKSFADVVAQKAAEADKEIVAGKASAAFDTFGAYAADEVRQAWKEAEEETGGHFAAGGLWISNDGKHAHITQIMLERAGSWLRGEAAQYNLLGNSVESAIRFAEEAIYGIDHPLAGQPTRSMEVQQEVMKERAFYEAFLNKLVNLD